MRTCGDLKICSHLLCVCSVPPPSLVVKMAALLGDQMKGHLVNPYATAAVASMDYHKSYQHLLHLSGHDLMNHHHQQQQQQILQHQAESAAVSVSSSPPVNVSVRSDTPNDNNTNNGDVQGVKYESLLEKVTKIPRERESLWPRGNLLFLATAVLFV